MEKALFIQHLIFLKLLLFSSIGGQAAAAALTFLQNREIKALLLSNRTLYKSVKAINTDLSVF